MKNQKLKIKNQKSAGLTLIEVIVGTSLVLIVFLGILGTYQLILEVISYSRIGITALAIANQRMEEIRSLSYHNIGVIGGVPVGPIPAEETITRNRINFTVRTTIIYIDDSFDRLAPHDPIPTDYKRIETRVSWKGFLRGERVLVTNISPVGKETARYDTGTLSILVFNAQGIGVAGANIHILNNKVSPIINVNHLTNPEGRFVLVGAPESEKGYQITITKTGYSIDRTFGKDEVAEPLRPHVSVFEEELTEISFSIDRVSSLRVETRGSRELGYPLIPNLTFSLKGARIIGHNIDDEPVYKYFKTHTTDSLASTTISGLKWDSYTFSVDRARTGFHLIGIESPLGTTTTQPINLLPNTHKEVRLILGAENSLLVTVRDSLALRPIFGAKVRVHNLALGYNRIIPTDEQGRAFFAPLIAATYNLEVSAPGYLSATTTVSVSGDTFKNINLTR